MRTSGTRIAGLVLALGACASAPRPSPAPVLAHHHHVAAPISDPPADPEPDVPPRIVITETSIEMIENIGFVADTTTIEPADLPHLDLVARSIFANDDIRKVEVQVYIGDGVVADRDERLRLATDRANVIIEDLVARGVERDRMAPLGQIDSPQEMNPAYVVLERDGL